MTPPVPIRAEDLDLARLIGPGDTIVVGQGTAEPLALTTALVRQRHAIGRVGVFLGAAFSDTFAPESADTLAFTSYAALGKAARLAKAGCLDVLPCQYRRLPDLFARGDLAADVVMLQLGPGDGNTGMTLGLANDHLVVAARRARVVIVEINHQVPWTFGAEAPADLRVDLCVAATCPPVELAPSRTGEVDDRIAARVAALIPDGATIEIGFGSLPDAILTALGSHRDLGIHSGMIGDRVVDLIEAGVVTNARKSFDAGVTVAGLLWGTCRLNAFADRNPALRLCPPSYTHGIDVLARIPNFFAVNSAIEVDLTGQVNAEVANGVYVGGVGGQVDFVRGANASANGLSIIALPATAKQGKVSRIVPRLSGPVTSLRSDANVVVTEWGVADLRAQPLSERAHRMIAVAAPEFRDDLARAAIA